MGIFKFDEIAFNSTEKKKPVDEDKYTYLGLEHLDSDSIYVTRYGADVAPKGDKLIFPMFIKSDYFLDAAIKISVGSLSPTINWRDLKELKFELLSLEKQRKLAEVLWAIYDMKDKYKKLILATDELVKSQFIEMFGELGKDQKGWGLTTLDECCELNPKRPRNIDDELEVSFVPMPAVSEDGKIDCSDVKLYKDGSL